MFVTNFIVFKVKHFVHQLVEKQTPFTSFFLLFLAHIDEIEEASSTAEVTARAEIAVTLTDSDYAETDVTLSDTEVETVTDGESHQ